MERREGETAHSQKYSALCQSEVGRICFDNRRIALAGVETGNQAILPNRLNWRWATKCRDERLTGSFADMSVAYKVGSSPAIFIGQLNCCFRQSWRRIDVFKSHLSSSWPSCHLLWRGAEHSTLRGFIVAFGEARSIASIARAHSVTAARSGFARLRTSVIILNSIPATNMYTAHFMFFRSLFWFPSRCKLSVGIVD